MLLQVAKGQFINVTTITSIMQTNDMYLIHYAHDLTMIVRIAYNPYVSNLEKFIKEHIIEYE